MASGGTSAPRARAGVGKVHSRNAFVALHRETLQGHGGALAWILPAGLAAAVALTSCALRMGNPTAHGHATSTATRLMGGAGMAIDGERSEDVSA